MVLRGMTGHPSRLGRGGRKYSGFKLLIFVLLVVAAVFFGLRKFTDWTLNSANHALADGRNDRAESLFSRAAGLPFSQNRGHDGLAALALLEGNMEAAKSHFATVLERKPAGFGGDPGTILGKFIQNGDYQAGNLYRDFLLNWKKPEDLGALDLDFAAIALGNRDLTLARSLLARIPEKRRTDQRFQNLSTLVDRFEKLGRVPTLLDRNGNAIQVFDLARQVAEYAYPKLFAGWGEPGSAGSVLSDLKESDRLNRVNTTIDLNLQKAAFQAMQGFEGTLILLDPSDGGILAAYGSEGFNPFSAVFEPGSVIKVLTYGILLQHGLETARYAPKHYPGSVIIGGKPFFDWTTQGHLATIDEGMAVSCNLMFAQMGVDLGWPKLKMGLRQFFPGPTLDDQLFGPFTLGNLLGEPEGAFDLGRIAIGLDLLETSVLGLVLIPAVVANRGNLVMPRLVAEIANVEGSVIRTMPAAAVKPVFDETIAAQLLTSMEAAVDNPRGTARRAQVEGLASALKTGTAGDRPFDSIMVGLLPAKGTHIVFALYLHKGGKCEINGAKVAKNLQEQVKALAPNYLDP